MNNPETKQAAAQPVQRQVAFIPSPMLRSDAMEAECVRLRAALADRDSRLAEWQTLCAWGGTPEIIHQWIKGQQERIHACQDLEQQLAEKDSKLSAAQRSAEDARMGHTRYEFVRKLRPVQFASLFQNNITTRIHFDDLVDAAMSAQAPAQAMGGEHEHA